MIFWGWGRRTAKVALDGQTQVLRAYRYLHVFFFLQAAWGGEYAIATLTESGWAQRRVTSDEAHAVLAGRPLGPSPWARFSLLGAAVLVVVLVLVKSAAR